MLNVTKTYLPDLEKYISYLKGIWESGWITNHGPLALELEAKLKDFLGVKHLFFVNNGTIAIQIALKAAAAKGEVITTPFSYVATTSSIVWEGCVPVFADIDPKTLCICPKKVEEKISEKTSAILAVHVYGTPCDVEALQKIGRKYNIPVIYDAAHAFGVNVNNTSVLNYGDISTLSFHATKVFHTIEGGAIITNNDEIANRISYMRNFGHDGPSAFQGLGINGKASEFNAAMGLCLLPDIKNLISQRREACEFYDQRLSSCIKSGLVSRPALISGEDYNYSYYPIIFNSEAELLSTFDRLKSDQITARRYFYPSLNRLNYLENICPAPVSEDICTRVLCLPLFPGIAKSDQERVVLGIESVLLADNANNLVANA